MYTSMIMMGILYICRTHIFTVDGQGQIRQNRARPDPEEKPAAQLHHMEMNELLQNLLREIMDRDGLHGRLSAAVTVKHSLHPDKTSHNGQWTQKPYNERKTRISSSLPLAERLQRHQPVWRASDVNNTGMFLF